MCVLQSRRDSSHTGRAGKLQSGVLLRHIEALKGGVMSIANSLGANSRINISVMTLHRDIKVLHN